MRQSSDKYKINRKLRGFTLTELAIWMSVVGLLLSAVWAGASAAWSGYKFNRANQQILSVVEKVRNTYGASGKIVNKFNDGTLATNASITAMADGDGLLPSDMASGGSYKTALGGGFDVIAKSSSVMELKLSGVSLDNCVRMLVALSQSAAELKMRGLGTTATPPSAIVRPEVDPASFTPITVQTASGYCTSPDQNEVLLDFSFQ